MFLKSIIENGNKLLIEINNTICYVYINTKVVIQVQLYINNAVLSHTFLLVRN